MAYSYVSDFTHGRMFTFYQKLHDPTGSGTDNRFINVIPIGDKLIAATEGDYIHSETLDSVGRVRFTCMHVCMYTETY